MEPSDTLGFVLCLLSLAFLEAKGDPLWEWREAVSTPSAVRTCREKTAAAAAGLFLVSTSINVSSKHDGSEVEQVKGEGPGW